MTIAITGHRPDKLGNDYNLTSNLVKSIEGRLQEILDKYKPTEVITGMAQGIDTLWAKLAIKNKIPFIAAIPCDGQESKWPPESKNLYWELLSKAEEVVNVSPGPYAGYKMQRRNEYMVDRCNLLVAVWDGSNGGTANCRNYACQHDVPIVRINPNDFR